MSIEKNLNGVFEFSQGDVGWSVLVTHMANVVRKGLSALPKKSDDSDQKQRQLIRINTFNACYTISKIYVDIHVYKNTCV